MKNLLIALYFIIALVVAQTASAQTESAVSYYRHTNDTPPREHSLDLEKMILNVNFEPKAGVVNGLVTYEFRAIQKKINSVFFDAPGINIKEAHLGGEDVPFTVSAEGVTIWPATSLTWDDRDSISFVYTATPRKGLHFTGWNDPNNKMRKQIWTQGQATDHRYWIPSYDEANDKLLTETIITFNSSYQILSNGNLTGVDDNDDGTYTWNYAMTKPHASYLLMLGIGKYKIKNLKSKSGVPINLWYYPDWEERFETTYRHSVDAMNFLESHIGVPYPWETYSQIPVQDFIYGAMENTTATLFGDFSCADVRSYNDRNYVGTNVHELTHQWFGDLITHRHRRDIWLHESYATFYTMLFYRDYYGKDVYEWNRRSMQNSALIAAKSDNVPLASTNAGRHRHYPKGATIIDMMMYTFGEPEYQRVIKHYLNKYAYQNVETNDLYKAYQDELGLSPKWFFDQWILRGGEPHYKVKYEDVMVDRNWLTLITVRQIHPRNDLVKLFKMPINFDVYYTDGTSERKQQMIEKETEKVYISNPDNKVIDFVLFDPGSNVLKKVTFTKSLRELASQANKAPNMIDRYDAVYAMREMNIEDKRDILISVYKKESFHAIKTEILGQLLSDNHLASYEIARMAISDKTRQVRQYVVENTTTIPKELLKDYETLLKDSSYYVIAAALKKLCELKPGNKSKYLGITKDEYGMSMAIRTLWLELKGGSTSIKELVNYTSNSYEFITRQNAMKTLKRMNYLDKVYTANLFEAMLAQNHRLGAVAKEIVSYYYKQNDLKGMIKDYMKSKNWEDWEMAIIKEAIG